MSDFPLILRSKIGFIVWALAQKTDGDDSELEFVPFLAEPVEKWCKANLEYLPAITEIVNEGALNQWRLGFTTQDDATLFAIAYGIV